MNYAERAEDLNRLVVTAFVRSNSLQIGDGLLAAYMMKNDEKLEEERFSVTTIEDAINIFELAVSKNEQSVNGAVYTPKYIRDYIVHHVFSHSQVSLDRCLCADISCGCGALLYTVAHFIQKKTSQTYAKIFSRLYGVDISSTSIERAKIILAMAALKENDEVIRESAFHLYTGDSLTFNFMALPTVAANGGFDIIVDNPPYVRSKHINAATKANLCHWETSKAGNTDLYIPFFEIGYKLLNDNGQMGYITVNSFFKSVNARALRKFFKDNEVSLSIIDFGQQLVFKKKLAYTCLAFISKKRSTGIGYTKGAINDVKSSLEFNLHQIEYSTLDSHRGWNLNDTDVLDNIRKIEDAGDPLGDKFVIKNGIATLANDIYIFRPIKEDKVFFYLKQGERVFPIERNICKDIIKPNIIKTEEDIQAKVEKIIFPYDKDYNVLPEEIMLKRFPYAYQYLLVNKSVLDARDKGEGDYGKWYAFGRTQALTDIGRKLLFPYMSDQPHFVYSPQKDMMIYCGYAIYNDSERELLVLKRVLESSVFDYYIRNTSKPYSTGYYSYAKNYVKFFGIYPFNEEEKRQLLLLDDKLAINNFVADKYKVVI